MRSSTIASQKVGSQFESWMNHEAFLCYPAYGPDELNKVSGLKNKWMYKK